ncbi:hypothetical protein HU200_002673 [Digitaria exilis]|uniref:Uncharacterized protein n=1 Tax=Digitaria exilis TaxID=1010633 RepID=A0A835FWP6_9POAL|nr:hypothetical protein HU200_002673 [Digitaria exilis]
METRAMVFLAVMVGVFGVTSAVLGFMAEAKKLKVSLLQPADIGVEGTECVYPANPAYSMAVGAILLLVVSQIIASAAGSCCGCCCQPEGSGASKKSTRQIVGVVVSVLAWIAAVIAVVYYWLGAALNAPQRRDAAFADGRNVECLYLKNGVFIRAAVLSLIATSLAIKSCILLRAPAASTAEFKPESGVAIGLPQWPAQGYGQARA